jgi:hypothetical protein
LFFKELFMGVTIRIYECCLDLLCLQGICGLITGNGDTASVSTGREDTVAGHYVSISLEHDCRQEASKFEFWELVLSSFSCGHELPVMSDLCALERFSLLSHCNVRIQGYKIFFWKYTGIQGINSCGFETTDSFMQLWPLVNKPCWRFQPSCRVIFSLNPLSLQTSHFASEMQFSVGHRKSHRVVGICVKCEVVQKLPQFHFLYKNCKLPECNDYCGCPRLRFYEVFQSNHKQVFIFFAWLRAVVNSTRRPILYQKRRHPLARKNKHWRNQATICTHSVMFFPRTQLVTGPTLVCPFGDKN